MRRLMISSISSRLAAYRHHRNGAHLFSGSLTTVSNGSAPPPQGGGHNITWLMNMHKHHRFMSTRANPLNTPSRYNEPNMKDEEMDATRIKVISREHVKPSSPTPQNLKYYKLSILDQFESPAYNSLLLFYPNHIDTDNKNIEEVILNRSNHLKRSLSETLTRVYPFAGKVASELHVDCNDDGVYYIETRVNDRLDNVLHKPDYKFLQRLIPVVDSSEQVLGSFVTLVQVNFFNCGGVSITVKHNHKFADACSTMTFLNVWASIARQDRNQVYPTFITSSSVFPQNPQLPFAIPLWHLRISPAVLKPAKSATGRFVFNALALRELKVKASKHEPVSRVLAVLALLWKCVTVETQSKSSVLHLPVDIRSRCSPVLPEYSIGNCIMGTNAKFDPAAATGNILETASMAEQLKNAIKDVNAEAVDKLRSEKGHVRFVESLRDSMETFCDYKTEYIMSSSLCNLGSKEADFGWGKPVWTCVGNQLKEETQMFTNRIMLVDSCCDEGIEAWVTLEKEVMDAVKCNPELLSFASVDPSPL